MRIKTKAILLPVLAAVAVAVLLGGCKKQSPAVPEEPTAEVITEVLTEPETEATTEEETTEAETTEPETVKEEKPDNTPATTVPTYDSHFAKQIEGRIDADMMILDMMEQDFNGDGKQESFAVVVEKKKSGAGNMDSRKMEYWFYSDKVSKRLWTFEAMMGMEFPTETMQLDDSGKYIGWVTGVGPSAGGGLFIYSTYAVNRSGEPVLLLKSNEPLKKLTNGALQLAEQQMGDGRQAWFTFDARKCTLVESSGKQISTEDFGRILGGSEILDTLQNKGEIGDLYYRAPGIVSVNYKAGSVYHCVSYMVGKDNAVVIDPVAEIVTEEPFDGTCAFKDATARSWNDEPETFAITVADTKKFPY